MHSKRYVREWPTPGGEKSHVPAAVASTAVNRKRGRRLLQHETRIDQNSRPTKGKTLDRKLVGAESFGNCWGALSAAPTRSATRDVAATVLSTVVQTLEKASPQYRAVQVMGLKSTA